MGNLIYLTTKEGNNSNPKLLSYSVDELESLIDDLVLSVSGVNNEDLKPFLNTISLLTEIKMIAKSN